MTATFLGRFGLLILVSVAAYGDLRSDTARCAQVDGDLTRLECFDQVARDHDIDGPVATKAAPLTDAGKWAVSDTTNPVNDSRTVVLVLMAHTGQTRFGEPISLALRCLNYETRVMINWNDYLGSDSSQVTLRVGKDRASKKRWGLSTDSHATFYPGGGSAHMKLIKRIAEVDSVVAQVTPYNENPVTAIFDVRGLSNVLEPLRATCNWP